MIIKQVVDEELIRLVASTATTGANIHRVNTGIGLYRNGVSAVNRMLDIIQEQGELPGYSEDLQQRFEYTQRHERWLRERLHAARTVQLSGKASPIT